MAQTCKDMMAQLKQKDLEITTEQAKQKLSNGSQCIFLDVREADEAKAGTIPHAVHIPRGFLEVKVERELPDRNADIVVYCAGGIRSLFAAETLKQMGYPNAKSMIGGYSTWTKEGFPIEKQSVSSFTDSQRILKTRLIGTGMFLLGALMALFLTFIL